MTVLSHSHAKWSARAKTNLNADTFTIMVGVKLTSSSSKVVKVFLNLCLKWSAFERVFFLFLAK